MGPDSRVFSSRPPPRDSALSRRSSSHRLTLPFRVLPIGPIVFGYRHKARNFRQLPLMRFLPPTAPAVSGSPLCTGLPSPLCSALRVSTLSTVFFSRNLPALFHADNAPGVVPFRAFPSTRIRFLLGNPVPSCRYPLRVFPQLPVLTVPLGSGPASGP